MNSPIVTKCSATTPSAVASETAPEVPNHFALLPLELILYYVCPNAINSLDEALWMMLTCKTLYDFARNSIDFWVPFLRRVHDSRVTWLSETSGTHDHKALAELLKQVDEPWPIMALKHSQKSQKIPNVIKTFFVYFEGTSCDLEGFPHVSTAEPSNGRYSFLSAKDLSVVGRSGRWLYTTYPSFSRYGHGGKHEALYHWFHSEESNVKRYGELQSHTRLYYKGTIALGCKIWIIQSEGQKFYFSHSRHGKENHFFGVIPPGNGYGKKHVQSTGRVEGKWHFEENVYDVLDVENCPKIKTRCDETETVSEKVVLVTKEAKFAVDLMTGLVDKYPAAPDK